MLESEEHCDYSSDMIITLREGKAKLGALVECASRGEEVVFTVRGKPMARLFPMEQISEAVKRKEAKWDRALRDARAIYSEGTHNSGAGILDELRGEGS